MQEVSPQVGLGRARVSTIGAMDTFLGEPRSTTRCSTPTTTTTRRSTPSPATSTRRSGRAACSGARSTAASTTSSAARSATPSSTRRSTRSPRPGAMHDYFRGNPDGKQPATSSSREREPIPAEYRDRDARVAKLDEFRASRRCWLFPTLGMLYEELLKHDIEARSPRRSRAFNRWLDDDWGFAYQDRIFAAPYIIARRSRLGHAASSSGRSTAAPRTIVMRPAAPRTRDGQLPVSDPAQRPVLGSRATRPASPSSCTPATAATRATATRTTGSRPASAAAAGARRSRRSTSSAPPTTS